MRRFLLSLVAICLLALPIAADQKLAGFGSPGGHLTGFWQAPSSAAATPTLTFVGCTSLTSNLQTYTFTDHATGTAGANRTTVVGILVEDGVTTFSIDSGTIGGSAATMMGTGANDTGSRVNARFMGLANPTGPTATIAFTLSEQATGAAICVWGVYDLQSLTPVAQNQAFASASEAMTLDVNTNADGVVLGISVNSVTTQSTTWTGLAEVSDADSGEYSYSAADFDEDGTAATPLAITADDTGSAESVGKTISLR